MRFYASATIFLMLLTAPYAYAQSGQWRNDQPLWEYEDETPVIPVDIVLKLFNLTKAYHRAGDYHNDHFKPQYSRREHPNAAFAWRWEPFASRWIGFNEFLRRFERSVRVNASHITADRVTIDLDHSQLAGQTRMVLRGIIKQAKDLTSYLEDDIVIEKWETFITRLTQLEEKLKDLK